MLKYLALVLLSLGVILSSPGWTVQRVTYPAPTQDMLLDVSNSLSQAYLNRMQDQLSIYPFEIKAVFLPQTKGISLSKYAKDLFLRWKLSSTSLLLVVALDREKIGVHAGKGLIKLKEPLEMDMTSNENTSSSSEETDYLEKLPGAVETVIEQTAAQETPSTDASPDSKATTSTSKKNSNSTSSKKTSSTKTSEKKKKSERATITIPVTWLIVPLIVIILGVGGWFGFVFWRKSKKNRELREKYLLDSQITLGEMDKFYEKLQKVILDLERYQSITAQKIASVKDSLKNYQIEIDDIYDNFDERLEELDKPDKRQDSIDFFDNMETLLSSAKERYEQGNKLIENLRDVAQQNSSNLSQCQSRQQQLVVRLQEIRRLHNLQLVKLYRTIKEHQQSLQALTEQNINDPMGIRKALEEWQKSVNNTERDIQAIPHIWQQVNQTMKVNVQAIEQRAMESNSLPPQTKKQIQEAKKLLKQTIKAIENGDVNIIQNNIQILTSLLQTLESQV